MKQVVPAVPSPIIRHLSTVRDVGVADGRMVELVVLNGTVFVKCPVLLFTRTVVQALVAVVVF